MAGELGPLPFFNYEAATQYAFYWSLWIYPRRVLPDLIIGPPHSKTTCPPSHGLAKEVEEGLAKQQDNCSAAIYSRIGIYSINVWEHCLFINRDLLTFLELIGEGGR